MQVFPPEEDRGLGMEEDQAAKPEGQMEKRVAAGVKELAVLALEALRVLRKEAPLMDKELLLPT